MNYTIIISLTIYHNTPACNYSHHFVFAGCATLESHCTFGLSENQTQGVKRQMAKLMLQGGQYKVADSGTCCKTIEVRYEGKA